MAEGTELDPTALNNVKETDKLLGEGNGKGENLNLNGLL